MHAALAGTRKTSCLWRGLMACANRGHQLAG